MSTENEEIAGWLLRITGCHHNWGFLLCYFYLRNVKGLPLCVVTYELGVGGVQLHRPTDAECVTLIREFT